MIYIILSLFWIGVVWLSCIAISYFWFRVIEGLPAAETETVINNMFSIGDV